MIKNNKMKNFKVKQLTKISQLLDNNMHKILIYLLEIPRCHLWMNIQLRHN